MKKSALTRAAAAITGRATPKSTPRTASGSNSSTEPATKATRPPMPKAKTPDIQFFLSTVSAEERGAKPHPFPGFTLVYYPMRPQSRGWVRIHGERWEARGAAHLRPGDAVRVRARRGLVLEVERGEGST